MKLNNNVLVLVMIFALVLASCNKFLDMTPKDKKVVSTVEDYRDIMASFMKFIKTPNPIQTTLFGVGVFTYPYFDMSNKLATYTDEATLSKSGSLYDKDKGEYTAEGKQLITWSNVKPYAWDQYFEFLGPINLIIANMDKAEGDNEDTRNFVKGEALVWRAYSYFKLVQYFSPYKNNEYGIPMHLDPTNNIGNAMPPRKTQTENFKQIISDCNEALNLLKTTPTNIWNFLWREDYIHSMMASIYTWKAMSVSSETSDWENAYKYATLSIGSRKLTSDPKVLSEIFDCGDGLNAELSSNSELIVRIADGNNYSGLMNLDYTYYGVSIVEQSDLVQFYKKYENNDIRRAAYFKSNGTFDKYSILGSEGGSIVFFRLAELVLIQAEAKMRMGNSGEALRHLNEFRTARYPGSVIINPSNILDAIIHERSLEFFMEVDYRWLDMKRLGVRLERIVSGEKIVLESDDFRYTFPVPAREMQYNRNMTQAPGWENIIVE